MRTALRLPFIAPLLVLALGISGVVSAQTLELPFEIEFSATELGSTLLVPARNAPPFDLSLGKPVGVSVRVDIDRVCGDSMLTNKTGTTKFPDVIRDLQIAVADLGSAVPLTTRQAVSTGSIIVELPAGQTVNFSECGGSSSLFYPNIPLVAVQTAATSGRLGLAIEITAAAPPPGVVLDRYATFIEGRITLVWHFEPGEGHGATAWAGTPTWTNLHQGLAGTAGRIPSFMGTGKLETDQYIGLVLWDVAPGASTHLLAGPQAVNLPFKGGVMVPFPNVRIPMTSNIEGAVVMTKLITSHVAGGNDIFIQFWVEDAGAPEGFSASNAARATP